MKAFLLLPAFYSFLLLQSSAQDKEVTFERLTSKDGLSQNNVLCMLQDSKGYLWFGTYDGLNRYDGYSFKIYKFDPYDTTSLSQNLIMSLWEGREGMIWVGTAGMGLSQFNPETEKFTRYVEKPHLPYGLHHRTISALNEDHRGRLWLGTYEGVSRFDKKTEEFNRIRYIAGDAAGISAEHPITAIYKNNEGTLWVGTAGYGLNKLILSAHDEKTPTISLVHYQHDTASINNLSSNHVTSICEDRQGMLWVGTANGLDQFDKKTGTWKHFRHDSEDPNSLSSNYINMFVFYGGGFTMEQKGIKNLPHSKINPTCTDKPLCVQHMYTFLGHATYVRKNLQFFAT